MRPAVHGPADYAATQPPTSLRHSFSAVRHVSAGTLPLPRRQSLACPSSSLQPQEITAVLFPSHTAAAALPSKAHKSTRTKWAPPSPPPPRTTTPAAAPVVGRCSRATASGRPPPAAPAGAAQTAATSRPASPESTGCPCKWVAGCGAQVVVGWGVGGAGGGGVGGGGGGWGGAGRGGVWGAP